MSEDVKRYDYVTTLGYVEIKDGPMVRHDDYGALLARAKKAELERDAEREKVAALVWWVNRDDASGETMPCSRNYAMKWSLNDPPPRPVTVLIHEVYDDGTASGYAIFGTFPDQLSAILAAHRHHEGVGE